MAKHPVFSAEDAFPAAFGDAMADVLADDRAIRTAMARRVVNVMRAQGEELRPDRFENRMLANRSFRAQIALMLHIPEKAAENLIGYANVLTDAFSRTLDSLAKGDISWQHATVIVDELGALPASTRSRIEEQALDVAPFITANQLGRLVRQAREEANPESIPERHESATANRGVSISDERDGMSTLFWTAKSAHVHAAFNRLTTGSKGIDGPLETRTLDQRRSDLLGHILLSEAEGASFGVVPDEHDDDNYLKWFRGIHATVVVSVPVLTLLGQSDEPATLDGCVPIDPETARVLAAGAKGFTRVLTHPETGVILSVGRKQYKVPADLRRYLQIRDGTCRFPGCTIAAGRCDIDHTLDWQFGGETDHVNLGCLCRGHHRLKDVPGWTVTQASDGSGIMTWTDPSGRSYTEGPQRPLAA